MKISASLVKELRERSGAGMMDCKKALVETDGDMEKALIYLREKGMAKAAKKAGRVAAEGAVVSRVDDTSALMMELNCETDFAGKSADFLKLAESLTNYFAEHAVEENRVVDMSDTFYDDKVEQMVTESIATIGENIKPRRFVRYTTDGNGLLHSYIHMGGKIGVLLELAADKPIAGNDSVKRLAANVAMQIAAMNPECVDIDSFPKDKLETERAIATAQVKEMGKPENMIDRIVDGKLKKFIAANTLLEQEFALGDGDKKVKDLVKDTAKEIGADLRVVRFVRFELGEGIEKQESDFAAEVAAQMNA